MSPSASQTSRPIIERAADDDLPRILALLGRAGLPTAGVAETLRGFFVARDGGDIVGVVGIEVCRDRYALLRSTAVTDEWKGRGLGKTLVERAIADAKASGIEALYLLTTTAEHYFPSFGFSRVSREDVPPAVKGTEEFVSACPASATVMVLCLTRSAS
jgi:amino-acid N-acetyltransferase